MHQKDFMTIVNKRIDNLLKTLANKEIEYSRGSDRLHNFKYAARIRNCSPIEALEGMWVKHVVSIFDIIDNCEKGIFPSRELINDKMDDMHNYLFLLEALIEEGKTELENKTPSTDVLKCANCSDEHDNAPNWYCKKCSDYIEKATGFGYLDKNGLKSRTEEKK